jgi:hypothetical protein
MSDPRPDEIEPSGTSDVGAGDLRGGPLPDFDADMTRIAGYTEPHHEVVVRIFVSLSLTDADTWRGRARLDLSESI